MASANSNGSDGRRKAFEDLLHCMICFEAYRVPKMLHCGHTFCAECLGGYLRTYQQQRRSVPGKLPCPTCRELTSLPAGGISGLKNDFKVKKIEEMFKTVNITNRMSSSMVCDPCKAQKKSATAISFCPNCSMNYCNSCLKKHAKNPVFKNHHVIEKRNGNGSDLVCRVHSDERGRYFCKTCEMVVCTICIVQGHDGHNVMEIDALFKQHQKDIHVIKNLVETRLSKLQKRSTELEKLRQLNLSSCQQAEIEIKERTKTLIDALQKEEHQLLDQLREKRDEKLQKISKELERVEFHVGKAYSMSEFAGNTLNKSSIQMIAVHEEFIQRMRTVAEADTSISESQSSVVTFMPGRVDPSIGRIDESKGSAAELARVAAAAAATAAANSRTPPRAVTRLVSVDQSPSSHGSRAKLLFQVNHCGSKRGELRDPFGIACLLNGDIVVTEWGNKRVQLFDSVGKCVDLIGSGHLHAPQGVAVTLKGNIIVTDGQQKRLQVFSPSGNSLAKWGLGKFFTPCGICISPNGNCIVTDAGEHSVSIYQGEKTCLKRFGSQGDGEFKFHNPLYVTTGQHNEIIISDSDNHCIKLYSSTGKYLGRFGGQGHGDGNLHFPRGVCSDQNGNIVVADRNNNRVSLFASNGFFIRHLLTKEDGVRDPYGVALSVTGNLVITESSSNRAAIKMFQI